MSLLPLSLQTRRALNCTAGTALVLTVMDGLVFHGGSFFATWKSLARTHPEAFTFFLGGSVLWALCAWIKTKEPAFGWFAAAIGVPSEITLWLGLGMSKPNYAGDGFGEWLAITAAFFVILGLAAAMSTERVDRKRRLSGNLGVEG